MQKSETLRENNLIAFKNKYGSKPAIDSREDAMFRMEEAADGEAILIIRNALPTGDLRLNSSYDPSYEATVWARGREQTSRRTVVILCGLATGVYLKALLSEMRSDTEFYVYEPNQALFSFVCSYVDLSDLISNPRVHLFILKEQINRMTDTIHNMVIGTRPEVIGIVTPFYAGDEQYNRICDEIGSLSVALRNYKKTRGRNALKCRIYAWNHLNTEHVLSDFKTDDISDYPAVIVAAGPSLKKNAHLLKELKNKAFILATDRALDTLKENGVIPDAAISVDAEKSADFLKYAIDENIPVLSSYQLNIEAQKKLSGKLIYFDEISYERNLMQRSFSDSPIDMGGNVAGAAYSVLRIMGFKKIILVGQDLAYLDGKHHSDDRNDGMDEIEDMVEIPGSVEASVKSNKMWIKYRDFYERQIKMYPDVEVIDATEGGTLISGSRVMPLIAVIDNIQNTGVLEDFEKLFRELPPALDKEGLLKAEKIKKEWINQLDEISSLSSELEAVCEDLLEECRTSGINSASASEKLRKLDELRRKLLSMEMNNLLEEYWVEDMYSIPPRVLYVRTGDEAMQNLKEAADYYKLLREDAKSLRQEMETGNEK